jgi:demethylmenaquinone methyltransferase/2-methoxy-6-polyprenyl-1,4-benzoquinol methylase
MKHDAPVSGAQVKKKADSICEMFGSIASRYDFLNHFLSANVDRRWRRICASAVEKQIRCASPRILDVGCGTADLALEFSRLGPVVGCDFCWPMLQIGSEKLKQNSTRNPVRLLCGDALQLPFPDSCFDVVTSAFVLRNLANLEQGIREMRRVLRPGGILAALEFTVPGVPLIGPAYIFYFAKVLPWLGRMISGNKRAYSYLPESVKEFPRPEAMSELFARCGFTDLEWRGLSAGVAILYLGNRLEY